MKNSNYITLFSDPLNNLTNPVKPLLRILSNAFIYKKSKFTFATILKTNTGTVTAVSVDLTTTATAHPYACVAAFIGYLIWWKFSAPKTGTIVPPNLEVPEPIVPPIVEIPEPVVPPIVEIPEPTSPALSDVSVNGTGDVYSGIEAYVMRLHNTTSQTANPEVLAEVVDQVSSEIASHENNLLVENLIHLLYIVQEHHFPGVAFGNFLAENSGGDGGGSWKGIFLIICFLFYIAFEVVITGLFLASTFYVCWRLYENLFGWNPEFNADLFWDETLGALGILPNPNIIMFSNLPLVGGPLSSLLLFLLLTKHLIGFLLKFLAKTLVIPNVNLSKYILFKIKNIYTKWNSSSIMVIIKGKKKL